MSAIITNRLDRRRVELFRRFQMIEADEFSGPGGEIAFYALRDEFEFLRELYEVMLLDAYRRRLESDLLAR